jgi:hypothetical protein
MNAVVEVATAETVVQVSEVTATSFCRYLPLGVVTNQVATSTTHAVISQGNHSISAVAPDNSSFGKELAVA